MEIIVNSKKHGSHTVLIDDEDFYKISKYKWYLIKGYSTLYAYTSNNRNILRIHRLILNITDPKIKIDHKNHNGLDNRKENLRICTQKQNTHNSLPRKGTSKYKGVSKVSKSKKLFTANITNNGLTKIIGTFESEKDAAKAYNLEAKKLHGEFAYLNDVDNWENFDIESNKYNRNYSSKYIGVYQTIKNPRWIANIVYNNKSMYIGTFETEKDAGCAHNIKALELYGESYQKFNDIDNWKEFKIISFKNKTESQYHGIEKCKNNKWRAKIYTGRKRKNLGIFDTEIEAAQAYNKAALELRGDKAKLNKIDLEAKTQEELNNVPED